MTPEKSSEIQAVCGTDGKLQMENFKIPILELGTWAILQQVLPGPRVSQFLVLLVFCASHCVVATLVLSGDQSGRDDTGVFEPQSHSYLLSVTH